MAPIGPQLPPHLQKRKRTPEDDSRQAAPPAKTTRRDNKDEIALEDGNSSDDGYGPSAPAISTSGKLAPTDSRPSIGPSLPPQFAGQQESSPGSTRPGPHIGPTLPPSTSKTDEIPLDADSDSDSTGPAPPPKAGPAPNVKRVLGPAPPPADLSQRPTTDPDSDSDSDDGWGPALPSVNAFRSGASLPQPAQRPIEPVAPKRDDWMVAPPTSSGYREVDPTKIKSRKFASGRSAGEKPSGVSSIWTETPEEKARRLANAVLGREDPSTAPAPAPAAWSSTSSRRADEDKIRTFTEQTRGRSLVEEHQAIRQAGKAVQGAGGKKDVEEEDDPSKRAFDWEKDMKVGGQISNTQRQQMVNRAANFGGRFQKGSFL
ncbi:hypothetical protein QBC34DRAFT_400222 [Podospora aff. communis PSN243]|uniref:DUF3752 domain-containing protein n=1 Tax=Podospora aff. communis PSN243 TaxID=3040156 RepID=A0AAV9GV31_9PEZI|nr:hypothetical protein QBC34DRAFT_400222 [Podospora aff. communis PSN243]